MTDETSNNNEEIEYSVTDILQAHDILITILLGKIIGLNKNPKKFVENVKDLIEYQDISDNVKNHINLLLSPIAEDLENDSTQ